MAGLKAKKSLYMITAVLLALILLVVAFVLIRSQGSTPAYDTTEVSLRDDPEVPGGTNNTAISTVPEDTTNETAIDPEQVSTTTIEPMAIIVSYMKGIEGFEYSVERNPNGTQYVQFSSPRLVGTKCTNDKGVFASIIEKPTEDESATLNKKTTVSGTLYGLSLADASCTPDEAMLKEYQDAFSTPFTLLKKM